MKKTKDQLADAMGEIKRLRRTKGDLCFSFLLLLMLTVGFFFYNNYELSQELRIKNDYIKYIKINEEYRERVQEFKHKCLSLKKYAHVYHWHDLECFVNGIELDTLEKLDKALLHFRLGEAKK